MRRTVCTFVVRKPPKTGFLTSRPLLLRNITVLISSILLKEPFALKNSETVYFTSIFSTPSYSDIALIDNFDLTFFYFYFVFEVFDTIHNLPSTPSLSTYDNGRYRSMFSYSPNFYQERLQRLVVRCISIFHAFIRHLRGSKLTRDMMVMKAMTASCCRVRSATPEIQFPTEQRGSILYPFLLYPLHKIFSQLQNKKARNTVFCI